MSQNWSERARARRPRGFSGLFSWGSFLVVVSFYWPYGHRGGQNGMMGSAFSDVTELVRTSASTAAARLFRVVFMGFLSCCCEFLLAVRAQGWAERHDGIGFQRCHRTGQDEREHGGREDFQGCFHGVRFVGVVSLYLPYGQRGG